MFFLRIQSGVIPAASATAVADEVDAGSTTSEPLPPRSSHPTTSTSPSSLAPLELSGATSAAPAQSPRIHHTRGIIHLYRSCATSPSSYASAVAATTSSPSSGPTAPQTTCDSLFPPWRGTCLLVLAVPTYFSPENFIRFCGPEVEHASDVRFIRDDGVEERYSVLMEFEDQKSADGFYQDVNGWRFSSLQGEICHVLFIASVQYTSSYEIASSAPIGTIELPTCPVCIERVDRDISGIWAPTCDHSFQCSCASVWLNSSCQDLCVSNLVSGMLRWNLPKGRTACIILNNHSLCVNCYQKHTENSTCVISGFVGCGRYKEGHANNTGKTPITAIR